MALHHASSALHAVFRTWRHEEREEEAFNAHVEDSQMMTASIQGAVIDDDDADDEPYSPEIEGVTRIWLEGTDKLREEREGDDGSETTVRRGVRWWQYGDDGEAFTGQYDDAGMGTAADAQDLSWLADPGFALGALDLELTGRGRRAGRDVIRVRAHPRDTHRDLSSLDAFGEGADEYDFEVHAERGLFLRLEARRNGLPFSVFEAVSIEFDEPIPEERFTLEPPPGQPVRTLEELYGETESPSRSIKQRDRPPSRSSCPHRSRVTGT
jgi:hypothetical protein